ncbi:sugar phosphate nucleotidyltransferase [Carboxylicivirga sp. M1479]|uniref:nucleotidyltransferase family protein n=1 Tax=Carboxylicivirga sp. M1479 TaxID=2594476 RepID=UPI0021069F82|nr:sugar phosphate nucleotidyltransferase [Carboxylicivirga sp. M1479]
MIFAAGLGTRLKPLTNNLPKALAPFMGKPLLWHAIKSMEAVGVKRIVVNVHHFAQQIIDFVEANDWQADVIISDESDLLLETGGGLLKAKPFFIANEPVLIRNVDIITSTNLESFIYSHRNNKNDATLMVKKRNTSRYLLFDDKMHLCGWKNTKTQEQIDVYQASNKKDLAFSGMHIVEAHLLNKMGAIRPFSIIQAYLDLAAQYQINGYQVDDNEAWFDVGTIEKLQDAEKYYSGK